MLIHYIYINRNNKFDQTIPNQVLHLAHEYRNIAPDIEVRIHGYADILTILREYDEELARLFSLIDPEFGACMADIGRIACLYYFGGIYHDAHLMFKNNKALTQALELLEGADIIFELHPNKEKAARFLTRNTNMISGKAKLSFFDAVLQRQKNNLAQIASDLAESPSKRHNIWTNTTMPFLEEFIQANLNINSDPASLHDVFKIVTKITIRGRDHYVGVYRGLSCYFMPFELTNLPKFYNDGMINHWSTLQHEKPLLLV